MNYENVFETNPREIIFSEYDFSWILMTDCHVSRIFLPVTSRTNRTWTENNSDDLYSVGRLPRRVRLRPASGSASPDAAAPTRRSVCDQKCDL